MVSYVLRWNQRLLRLPASGLWTVWHPLGTLSRDQGMFTDIGGKKIRVWLVCWSAGYVAICQWLTRCPLPFTLLLFTYNHASSLCSFHYTTYELTWSAKSSALPKNSFWFCIFEVCVSRGCCGAERLHRVTTSHSHSQSITSTFATLCFMCASITQP